MNSSLGYRIFISQNMQFMVRWKVAGELVRPKNITHGSNSPFGVLNAAFHSSPSLIQRCSPKNSVSLVSWSWDSGYILQSRFVRVSSFRLIVWSSSLLGGNLSASFSSNTLECRRYSSGICSAVAIVVLLFTHALGQGIVTFPFSQSIWGLKVCSHG